MSNRVARVTSLNVGGVRHVDWQGRDITTGIWKQPVETRLALRGVNFEVTTRPIAPSTELR
jgi:hypothetical protein